MVFYGRWLIGSGTHRVKINARDDSWKMFALLHNVTVIRIPVGRIREQNVYLKDAIFKMSTEEKMHAWSRWFTTVTFIISKTIIRLRMKTITFYTIAFIGIVVRSRPTYVRQICGPTNNVRGPTVDSLYAYCSIIVYDNLSSQSFKFSEHKLLNIYNDCANLLLCIYGVYYIRIKVDRKPYKEIRFRK